MMMMFLVIVNNMAKYTIGYRPMVDSLFPRAACETRLRGKTVPLPVLQMILLP